MLSRLRRPFLTALLVGFALACAAAVHVVMERASRYAETELGAYLWWQEEYLQLFTPSNYVGRGDGRLLLFGPSEAREGFLLPIFDAILPDLRAYQHAQSVGTFEDMLIVLEYIERVHGDSAIPDAIVVGITTRFVSDIRHVESPLQNAIDRYSPVFSVDRSRTPPALVPKSRIERWRASFRFRRRQQRRYSHAVQAVLREAAIGVAPALRDVEWLGRGLTPAKYHHLDPIPDEVRRSWLEHPQGMWPPIHAWRPREDREHIEREFRQLRAYASRHACELYLVNMPELPHNRSLYPPGIYDDYLRAVRDSSRDVPFLDLRLFLGADEYYDTAHPTRAGAERVSRAVARFVARERGAREARARAFRGPTPPEEAPRSPPRRIPERIQRVPVAGGVATADNPG